MENHWIYYEELKKISVGKNHWIYYEELKKISVGKPLLEKKDIHWIYYEELKKISVGKPLNILWRVKKDICWKTTEYIMKS